MKLTYSIDRGNPLSDKNRKGKERPWKINKQVSMLLSEVYEFLEREKLSERVRNCSYYLKFLECVKDPSHPKKLKSAYFCGDRLCPACQCRRAYVQAKVAYQASLKVIKENPTYRFLFLTLTIPSVRIDKLEEAINLFSESWNRLVGRKELKRILKGYHRALEVTYNKYRDDYHPHVHAVLVVNSSYFGKNYILHERWLELWQQVTRMPEIQVLNIKPFAGRGKGISEENIAAGIAEACKYSLKEWNDKKTKKQLAEGKIRLDYGIPGHIWIRIDKETTAKTVEDLRAVISGRKLAHFGGCLLEAKKALNLKDGEEATQKELLGIDEHDTECACSVCGSERVINEYIWDKLSAHYYGKMPKSIEECVRASLS